MPDSTEAEFIAPDQLCVGLYVHLDLSWMDHPFTFSSFLIKNSEQIEKIRALGLEKVRIESARSSAQPLPASATPNPPQTPAEPDPRVLEKRESVRRHHERTGITSLCEKQFSETTQTLKAIQRNLFSRPDDTRERTRDVVSGMVESMLTDKDIAVNLMPERIAGEEMYLHSLNVTVLSLMLAREMNAPREQIVELGIGAVFHDVGKQEVPDRIRLKQDPLTKAELSMLHEHVGFGLNIGKRLNLSAEAMTVIAQHHEYVDGSGYPGSLKSEKISLLAKIATIANTYDNLCNPTNPARALTPHEALSVMYSQQRSRFEPAPLSVFIRCLGVYPPGTIVVLGNEAFGIVTSVNSTRPLRPVVQVYDARATEDETILINLESEPELTISRTIRPSQLPKAVFDRLAPRKRVSYFFDAHGESHVATERQGA